LEALSAHLPARDWFDSQTGSVMATAAQPAGFARFSDALAHAPVLFFDAGSRRLCCPLDRLRATFRRQTEDRHER
jgi:hypothetical protein